MTITKTKTSYQDFKDNCKIIKQDNNNLSMINKATNDKLNNITLKMETSLLCLKKCLQDNKQATLENILTYDNTKEFANNVNSLKSSFYSHTWNTQPLVTTTPLNNDEGKKIATIYNLTNFGNDIVDEMIQARK